MQGLTVMDDAFDSALAFRAATLARCLASRFCLRTDSNSLPAHASLRCLFGRSQWQKTSWTCLWRKVPKSASCFVKVGCSGMPKEPTSFQIDFTASKCVASSDIVFIPPYANSLTSGILSGRLNDDLETLLEPSHAFASKCFDSMLSSRHGKCTPLEAWLSTGTALSSAAADQPRSKREAKRVLS